MNFLFAKKHGGDFVVRIEDTDKTREVEGAIDYLTESLNWLGIKADEDVNVGGNYGPYKQSERLDIYKKYADELIEKGFAYYAFDTSEELDSIREMHKASKIPFVYNYSSRVTMKNSISLSADEVSVRLKNKDPYVIRFKMPRNYELGFKDMVRGSVCFNSNNLDDKVLFKSDGYPTYHLANVVDDHLMEITHVIRAEEWLPSTPLHILLYDAFEWVLPEFCHLPLVLGPDKQKLSKRHASKYEFPIFPLDWDYIQNGNSSKALGFREAGYESEALLNFLALLGWNPGNDLEYMNMNQLISLFDIDRVNKGGAIFDINKLKSVNSHYVKNLSFYTACNKIISHKDNSFYEGKYYLDKSQEYNDDRSQKIVDMAKERSVFSRDLYPAVSFFFKDVVLNDDIKLKNDEEFNKVIIKFLEEVDNISWNEIEIKNKLHNIIDEMGLKLGKVLPDLRIALTGENSGPDLPSIMYILGKETTVERINGLLNKVKESVL